MKSLLPFTILVLSSFIENCIAQNIWEPTNGPNGMDVRDVAFTSDNAIVVSLAFTGIFISRDNGDHWQKISIGLEKSNSFADHLVAGSNGSVYALIFGNNYLYHLETGTDHWILTKYKPQFNTNIISVLNTNIQVL